MARVMMLTRWLLTATLLSAAPALAQTSAPSESSRRTSTVAAVIDACQADLRTVCGEEPFEAGRLSQCIERNKDKVSPACQAVWPSAAEPQAPRIQNRVVPMGERRLIGFFSSLYPDCSSQEPTVIRIAEQPRHGSVTFSNESRFPTYASSHHLSTCNLKKVEGVKIFYEPSDPDYSGLDEFSLLIIGPIGFAFDEKYRVSIR